MSEIFSARELSYQKEIKRLKTDKSVMRNANKDLLRENKTLKKALSLSKSILETVLTSINNSLKEN